MKMTLLLAAFAAFSLAPAHAEDVPGAADAAGRIAGSMQAFREARASRPAATPAATTNAPYDAHVSCHYSMGGSFINENGRRTASLAGRVNGVAGRFVFTASAIRFEPQGGGAAPSAGAVLSALNAALVERAHAVDSFDPGSMAHSRCGELLPPRPITDF